MSRLPSGPDICAVLASQAVRRSQHPFLVWEPFEGGPTTWTYAELERDVALLAGGLLAAGVSEGDFVLIHLTNCPEFVLTWFACARIGAVAVTTNAHASEPELRDYVERTSPVLAVTQPDLAHVVRACLPDEAVRVAGEASFAQLLTAQPAPLREPDLSALVSCQFTSGTTSRPKGVLWTHANAVWGAKATAMHQGLVPEDVHYVTNPLFHTNAQTYSLLPTLWVGGTVVLSPRFSASRFWDVSVRNGCTWHSITNFAIQALLPQPVPEGHRYRMWGGAVSDPPTTDYFGIPCLGWWGMTETITQGIVAEPYQQRRPGSMGRPSPLYELEVRDAEGHPVARGEAGELFIRGERGVSLFLEYLADPDATRDAFDDEGWFLTGDVVRLEEDGSITFSDRAKDLIKVGGENLAASEVELVIRGVEGVADVAVVAQPHVMLDEVPVAFVVATEPAPPQLRKSVLEACRSQLAAFKVPWEVTELDDLPKALLGKVNKAELRKGLPTLGSDAVRA
jgi:crotonobetaine/carnitine-CoA ligase